MQGIPPVKDSDAEDVVWGLQTAEALWKRGEKIDALVWLRRAAQAAGDAAHDDRALELARSAAELTEFMANQPQTLIPPGESGVDLSVEANAAQQYIEKQEAELGTKIPPSQAKTPPPPPA